ncbi:MAG: FAD binding domain-containing protein [Bacillota bacterium]|nr:FAD binding domain-containing protein [Bacillota bacterium]
MIPFDFEYYLPDTLKEASEIFVTLQKEGRSPLYYGGGTEIISMARVMNVTPGAVIDIKKIPECLEFGINDNHITIGAAVTLAKITASGIFPLLGLAAGRIADHTVQEKITLGGNLAGTIIYHESLLPLLISDSSVCLQSAEGLKEAPVPEVFSGGGLRPGELIVKISLEKKFAQCPYFHIKKSKIEKIGYPLVTVCVLLYDNVMRTAVSGLCHFPLRLADVPLDPDTDEAVLAENLVRNISAPIRNDASGSADYRTFILIKTVESIIRELKQIKKDKINA